MSVEIDTELKNFKDKVGNSLDSMKSAVNNLADKLSTAIASNNSTKDSLSANYKSENKEAVLSKFTSMNKKYEKIKNSVTGELNSALSSSQVLIDNVTKLEELKQAIEDAEAKKRSAELVYKGVEYAYTQTLLANTTGADFTLTDINNKLRIENVTSTTVNDFDSCSSSDKGSTIKRISSSLLSLGVISSLTLHFQILIPAQ